MYTDDVRDKTQGNQQCHSNVNFRKWLNKYSNAFFPTNISINITPSLLHMQWTINHMLLLLTALFKKTITSKWKESVKIVQCFSSITYYIGSVLLRCLSRNFKILLIIEYPVDYWFLHIHWVNNFSDPQLYSDQEVTIHL